MYSNATGCAEVGAAEAIMATPFNRGCTFAADRRSCQWGFVLDEDFEECLAEIEPVREVAILSLGHW